MEIGYSTRAKQDYSHCGKEGDLGLVTRWPDLLRGIRIILRYGILARSDSGSSVHTVGDRNDVFQRQPTSTNNVL